MFSPIEPFDSYGALLQRLLPPIAHALIAGPDGSVLWASDASAEPALRSTREKLISFAALSPAGVDGLAGEGGPDRDSSRYGFCVRGAHQESLAFILVAVRNEQGSSMDLATIHAHIKPAIECLQIELSAPTLLAGADSLTEIPAVAMPALSGVVGAMLLPDCNLSLSRSAAGQPRTAKPAARAVARAAPDARAGSPAHAHRQPPAGRHR
jgi:hypothetical protein